jgi:membrane-bound lytic murein transglycosylase B
MRSLIALMFMAVLAAPGHAESFDEFLRSFEWRAVAAGVSPEAYERATSGLVEDPDISKLVETQPEFSTPIWDYLDKRVSDKRIADGKAAMKQNAALFKSIGKKYGVDRYMLAAIWGLETFYGTVLDNPKYIKPIIPSLATLVYMKRSRLKGDTADFIAALKLVQMGPLDAKHLLGSWAGAIGHLQVNPTNVILHGTDGDGDGQVDLQNSLADALATSAKFLLDLGYKPHMDWGFEVSVPEGFDYLLVDRKNLRPISFFKKLGVKRTYGRKFYNTKIEVFLWAPAGATGPKFLMTPDFTVLKGYNQSDSYALSVSHLTDRLKGEKAFEGTWPRDTLFPNREQRIAIQAALVQLGFLEGPPDGRIGPVTVAAYAKYQASKGEVADGFITLKTYEELTGNKP